MSESQKIDTYAVLSRFVTREERLTVIHSFDRMVVGWVAGKDALPMPEWQHHGFYAEEDMAKLAAKCIVANAYPGLALREAIVCRVVEVVPALDAGTDVGPYPGADA